MGVFSRLFAGKGSQPEAVVQVSAIMERFTNETIKGVDREDVGRYLQKQYRVMAFHFGAIEYLASLHGLDETRTLGIFVAFLDRFFNMPVTETGSISERLQGFHDNPDERRYLAAGREACKHWHEAGDHKAPLRLGEMLEAG